jgi:phosphoribosyl 1,2-cyclic phosphodiesterase
MRVEINPEDFISLNNEELIHICMEQIFTRIRGKSPLVKGEVYSQLTDGQKAAFMFKIMFDHSKTIEEFYWYALYYISDLNAWPEMKSRAQTIGDTLLVSVYESIESNLEGKNLETHGNWMIVLDDAKTKELIMSLFRRYIEATRESIELLGSYIRKKPYEFIQ